MLGESDRGTTVRSDKKARIVRCGKDGNKVSRDKEGRRTRAKGE